MWCEINALVRMSLSIVDCIELLPLIEVVLSLREHSVAPVVERLVLFILHQRRVTLESVQQDSFT